MNSGGFFSTKRACNDGLTCTCIKRILFIVFVIMPLQRRNDNDEMLVITSGAPERGWQRQQHLIDSLAYVDTVTEEEKRVAQELIKEEMRTMNKRAEDYLEETPSFASVSSETSASDGRPSDIRLDTTR